MISKLCNICNSISLCKYCLDYGKNIGKNINSQIKYCNTCSNFEKCNFCIKYGKKKGKYYYKNYINIYKN